MLAELLAKYAPQTLPLFIDAEPLDLLTIATAAQPHPCVDVPPPKKKKVLRLAARDIRAIAASVAALLLPKRAPDAVPDRMTPEEARRYCGLKCKATLRNWRGQGLPFEKKGKLVWYLKKDLDAFRARGRQVSIDAIADQMFEATRG